MKIFEKIKQLFLNKSVYDQESDYLKRNGYPKDTVIFADSNGRVSKIIGINNLKHEVKRGVI